MKLKPYLDAYSCPKPDQMHYEKVMRQLPPCQPLETNKKQMILQIIKVILVRHVLILFIPLTFLLGLLALMVTEETTSMYLQFCGMTTAMITLYGWIRASLYHMDELEDTCLYHTHRIQLYVSMIATICSIGILLVLCAVQAKLNAYPMLLSTALCPYFITCLCASVLSSQIECPIAFLLALCIGIFSSALLQLLNITMLLHIICILSGILWLIYLAYEQTAQSWKGEMIS